MGSALFPKEGETAKGMTITIYVDADAFPVKEETYRVALRYGIRTVVVSNSFIQIPPSPLIQG